MEWDSWSISLVAIGVIFLGVVLFVALRTTLPEGVSVTCTGTVAVPLFNIGSTTLEDTHCQLATCRVSPFSIFSTNGNLALYLDGSLADSTTWSSILGTNQPFTMSSHCLTQAPKTAQLKLLDDQGAPIQTLTVGVTQ